MRRDANANAAGYDAYMPNDDKIIRMSVTQFDKESYEAILEFPDWDTPLGPPEEFADAVRRVERCAVLLGFAEETDPETGEITWVKRQS
jgi:hypothetical protein